MRRCGLTTTVVRIIRNRAIICRVPWICAREANLTCTFEKIRVQFIISSIGLQTTVVAFSFSEIEFTVVGIVCACGGHCVAGHCGGAEIAVVRIILERGCGSDVRRGVVWVNTRGRIVRVNNIRSSSIGF